jgi:hypothetical protein
LPFGSGLPMAGQATPARTTPANSPPCGPTVRAVLRSRAKAAAGDNPSRSISTPLARSMRTRCWSAHCSYSASSPFTVAAAAARNKLATTPASACKAATSLSFQSRGPAAYTSRVPMGPGQLHRHTQGRRQLGRQQRRATSLQRASASTSRTATGLRCCQATVQGPAPQLRLDGLGLFGVGVGVAGPGQQLILAGPHESGLEQELGRVHHLLETSGKPSLGSRVVRMPMLVARVADSMRIALVLPVRVIPSLRDRGSRVRGGPARGHPPGGRGGRIRA